MSAAFATAFAWGCAWAADTSGEGTLQAQHAQSFVHARDFSQGRLRGFVTGRARNRPDAAYFRDMVAAGANLARVFVDFQRCQGCDEYRLAVRDLEGINRVVGYARRYGFRVVLAGETGDEREGGLLWQRDDLKRSLIREWRALAERYSGTTEIAGYDLLNEPIVTLGSAEQSRAAWQELAAGITRAIREVDPNHVVIVQPTPGAEYYAFDGLEPIRDANLVYSVHVYQPHALTHQGVSPAYPRGPAYPSSERDRLGRWDKARLTAILESPTVFSRRFAVPIFVSEFSCIRWAPGNSRERYLQDLLEIFDSLGWSWTYHEWRGWPGWDPEIASSDPEVLVRTQDSPIMSLLRRHLAGVDR
jgi:hypothetical protein